MFSSASVNIVHEVIRGISLLDSFTAQMKIQINPEAAELLLATTESTVSNSTINSVKSKLMTIIRNSVNTAYQSGSNYKMVSTNKRDQLFVWRSSGVRTCTDCKERDGRVETLDTWINIGLPKTGFSVCSNRCRCRLVKYDETK